MKNKQVFYSKSINVLKKKLCVLILSVLFMSSVSRGQVSTGNAAGIDEQTVLSKAPLNKAQIDNNSAIQKTLQYYDKQIYFTENKGQWPKEVLYKADFALGQALATGDGMIVGTFDPVSIAAHNAAIMEEEKAKQNGLPYTMPAGTIKGHGWMMNFVNHSPSMSIVSKDMHPDAFNYLLGGVANGEVSAANYQEVWYNNVYNNVDVRYYPSAEGTLEYDIVCKTGFNKNDIHLKFDGIDRITLKGNGHLVLKTSVGDMEFPAPVAYQSINGQRKAVQATYRLAGSNELRFELGQYDSSQPLIIDPIALRWATWITNNSAAADHGHCIWVDPSDGSIYVAARFAGTGLITVNAFQNAYAGGSGDDMVLGKYTEPGTIGGSGTRVWQTYLGGNGEDNPYAMEQGLDGNLYIVGYTQSTNFPLAGGTAFNGGGASINDGAQKTDNVFLVKFNTAGTSYKSAVVGGNGTDDPYDLRITSAGDIIVCGYTTSTNLSTLFPGTGASNTNNGGNDVLIFKINADLSAISWMKNYGGSGDDQANIMLTNKTTGDIFVAGQTKSGNFPTTNPRQAGGLGGSQDGFIQKLNSSASTEWSSYFKSASGKSTAILCMEFNTTQSKIYFGGITGGLNSANISTSGVYNKTYGGGTNDFFVIRMDTSQNFNMSTYLGGNNNEVNMMGLNVDLNNDVYIFGYSNSINFPVTSNALQSSLNTTGSGSNNDKTFTKLRSDLDSLDFSTFYGGTQDDYDPVGERGIKFSNCRIYTIVTSESNNIPLTQGAVTTSKLSSSSVYEPGLVVWANPPDLLGNTITGDQSICPGNKPSDLAGSTPSYSLPTISRNGTTSAYPVSLGSATTYEWQSSTDSVNWTDISGGNTQNLAGALIGPVFQKTFFRRIIGGDACVLAGPSAQVVTVKTLVLTGTVNNNVSCYGGNNGSVTVNPANGTTPYHYSWTNGATTQTVTNFTAGTFSVTVTDAAGCSASASFTVGQPSSALSATKASSPATCILSDGSASVTVAGGSSPYTYLWNNGATASSISSAPQGIYTVTVTDAHSCTLLVKDTIGINNTTTANAGGNAVITCITGPQITLNGSSATSGATYSWAAAGGGNIVSGSNTLTPVVNATGVYTLTVTKTSSGCSATSSASVTLNNSLPTVGVTANGPLTFCQGGAVTLSASGAVSYLWSNGATTPSITVSAQGTYSVTGTDAKSCSATSTGTSVTVNANPVVTISAGGPTTFCQGNSVSLNAAGAATYLWSNGATTSSISVNASGTYSVTGTNANNCRATSAGSAVVVNQNPVVNISAGGPTTFCQGSNVALNATGGVSYLWSTGATTPSITVSATGSYTVTGTNGNGCTTASSGTSVTVNSNPAVTISAGSPTTFCQGSSVTLTGVGAVNYVWSNGATTPSITINAPGTFFCNRNRRQQLSHSECRHSCCSQSKSTGQHQFSYIM